MKEWKSRNHDRYRKAVKDGLITSEEVEEINDLGIHSMGKLNKNAASLVNKYKAGACTDVTGFGILGHLENLAEAQKDRNLELRINKLPVIKKTDIINQKMMDFQLLDGYSAETSGGLMCFLNEKHVEDFQKELEIKYGEKSWVIGEAIRTDDESKATLNKQAEIIQVDKVFC